MAKMKYTGNGFKVGVPARDLSAEEVAHFGREYLLSLGLYEDATPPKQIEAEKKKPEPRWDKAKTDEPEKAEEA